MSNASFIIHRSPVPRLMLVAWLMLFSSNPVVAQETFYDAYELGLAHERAGRWTEALTALQAAVRLRPEAGINVPTFGLDVIDVYDPHIHLARIHLELGRGDEARRFLDQSRSAAVSPVSEIDSLALKLGGVASGPANSTLSSATPAPIATRESLRPIIPSQNADSVVVEPSSMQPTPTAVPTPVMPATEDSAIKAVAEPEETEPAASSGGGVGLLIAVAVVAAAVFLLLRRRSKREPDPSPDFDTTPTKRVETGPGRAARGASSNGQHGAEVVVGDYRLLERLGRGGMATTHRAERLADGAVVVVKIPHEHLLDDREFVERFVREGALGATIHHPNIIRIFAAGLHEGKPFIAMELVEGETLESRLARDGALPPAVAMEIARGIALALDYAHVKGVIHRDVKPDNVMLAKDSSVKVMDFGIARVTAAPGLTATNTFLGTPVYSAPEAIDPNEVTTQSDLYSLGIVLYRMLCNRVPFEAPSPLRVIELHRTAPLPPFAPGLEVPAVVEEMVRRLAAKDTNDRYPSAEAFLHDLNQYSSGLASD
jgi:serine/threonine-protein kinase